ncbi:MAG: protein kinase [Isosphaerales bacterium]
MDESHVSREEIDAYLADELNEGADTTIEAHLATGCDRCIRLLREIEESLEADRANETGGVPVPVPLPTAVRDRLEKIAKLFSLPGQPSASSPFPDIDEYEIVSEIGRGGMGVVYRAFDRVRGRSVALKVIKDQEFATKDDEDRFLREGEVARTAALSAADGKPAGIVPIYEVAKCGRLCYIAMEWIPDGTLESRVQDCISIPRESARIIEQVSRAVDRLHAFKSRLIHRDIKPANILLQRRPSSAGSGFETPPVPADASRVALAELDPLLSDFGLAKRPGAAGTTRPGSIIGTPAYMAPDQLREGSNPTPAMDIYSLGATLYHCLSGAPPFPAATQIDTYMLVERGHPPSPRVHNPRVPRDLAIICLKCLERAPDRRYATAGALADDLSRFLKGEPILARPPEPHRRARRWCRANPLAATVLAVLTSLLVVGAIIAYSALTAMRARAAEELANARIERAAAVEAQAAHDQKVARARDLARRGNWPRALDEFQRAIDDYGSDRLGLRVERLFGFFATNDREGLSREIDDLAASSDLSRLEAPFNLARGAYLLCDSSAQAKGRELIRKALQARDDLVFSPADPSFAKALAETRPRKVLEHLREAVRLDPLHFLANSSLLVALIATGELVEARRQCDQMQGFFPGAALPSFIRAMTDLIEGNREGMRRGLDDLARRLGPEGTADMVALRPYCERLLDILDLFNRFQTVGGGLGLLDNLKLGFAFGRLRAETGTAIQPFAFPVPTVGLMFQSVEALLDAYLMTGTTGHEASFRKLLALSEDYPEAMVLAMAAGNRLILVQGMINRAELAPARALLTEIARLSERAAETPTLVPRSPIRYQSRILCAIADVTLLKITPDPGRAPMARLWDNLRRLIVDGRQRERDRQQGLDMLLKMIVVPPTREQAADWRRDTPDGALAYRLRCRQLYSFGRALVENWLDDEPGNMTAKKWLDDLRAGTERQNPASDHQREPEALLHASNPESRETQPSLTVSCPSAEGVDSTMVGR